MKKFVQLTDVSGPRCKPVFVSVQNITSVRPSCNSQLYGCEIVMHGDAVRVKESAGDVLDLIASNAMPEGMAA